MKNLNLVLMLFLTICCLTVNAQNKEITGKVICSDFPSKDDSTEHEFWNGSGAVIFGNDSIRLGTANNNGEFKLSVTDNIHSISVGWVGMYPEKIELTGNCKFLEVILLPDVIYDFVTYKKEQRLRKKDRKVLPDLYRKAYEQGIFKNEEPCR
ncbi:hypothetical protein OKW21_000630 [Catalinimonas alkaloidigena]|uniref:hypothetical protein n=1 Tax=Catalinimonas alkaloidigena TaxID=1075417 RepID=UPI0024055C06|nr:hypothetical protein [Catalinimonas alkaloidigena]MDF9795367.1 hypothetical protein [Catalinimonas alkaloidigena]